MVEVNVNPGICGLKTFAAVESEDGETAVFEIKSDCPFISALADELGELDAYGEVFAKLGESEIYKLAGKHCKHAACPVPTALIKGVEAACGLALPKNVEITIEKK